MGRPPVASIDVATPERLLSAAESAFAVSGLDRATLAEIASHAGITRPSLLYHFSTKEELYEAVVGRAFSSLAGILRSALSVSAPFHEKLHGVVEGFLTFVQVHPALARIVVREVVSEVGPGRQLILLFGAPLIDDVVAFLEREGQGALRSGIPLRPAVMQLVSDVFLRTAAGDVRFALWGETDDTWTLLSRLLLKEDA